MSISLDHGLHLSSLTFLPVHREHLCGYDLNFTYPQEGGHFPTLIDPFTTTGAAGIVKQKPTGMHRPLTKRNFGAHDAEARILEAQRQNWKRDLTNLPNGTLHPYYGCFLFDELWDYATNFSFPWSEYFIIRNILFIPSFLNHVSASQTKAHLT